MKYKYSIKEKLENLPKRVYSQMRGKIIASLKKTPKTFSNYCNIQLGEHRDIPASDLDIIASVLGCRADDLKNYRVERSLNSDRMVIKSRCNRK